MSYPARAEGLVNSTNEVLQPSIWWSVLLTHLWIHLTYFISTILHSFHCYMLALIIKYSPLSENIIQWQAKAEYLSGYRGEFFFFFRWLWIPFFKFYLSQRPTILVWLGTYKITSFFHNVQINLLYWNWFSFLLQLKYSNFGVIFLFLLSDFLVVFILFHQNWTCERV